MKYCKKCLNVTTRPNIKFSVSGLCPPCENKPTELIDWSERIEELKDLSSSFAHKIESRYECILGVSGGKDSTRQALFLKEQIGLNPLLVSLNYPPDQISQRGVDNLSNLIEKGFDCINISCSPVIWKRAMRYSFLNFGNWAKATEPALFASVPRVAVSYQIPLIFWGESAANQLGDLGVSSEKPWDANRLKYSNTLQGGDIDWMQEFGALRNQVLWHRYPTDEEMERASLQIVFLDYFMSEFSLFGNGNYSALRGLSIRNSNPLVDPEYLGTSCLDEDFININMYVRYLKYGFGRTSDIVNLEIRAGRMTREQGIELVERFDANYDPSLVEKFSEYIDLTVDEFWEVVERYVGSELFERISRGNYRRKFKIGVGL